MPEPILVAIATAITGKGAASLYDAVKSRFGRTRKSAAVLAAAEGAGPDSREVLTLAEELSQVEQDDPEFASQLLRLWRAFEVERFTESASTTNQITGKVVGKVVQARDIQGGVSF